MIKIVHGCLLEDGPQLIAHQVNCKGKMKSGLAGLVRKLYPLVELEYNELCSVAHQQTATLLGNVQIILTEDHRNKESARFVANIFGQNNYGRDRQFTNTIALRMGLESLRDVMKQNGIKELGIPYKIGCGLGGADWNEVLNIIADVFEEEKELEIYIFDLEGEFTNGKNL